MIFNVNDHYFSLIIINIQYPGSKFQNLCWSLYKLGSNNSEIVPMTRPLKHCPKNFWRPKNVDLKTAKTRMSIYIYICVHIYIRIYTIYIYYLHMHMYVTPPKTWFMCIYISLYHIKYAGCIPNMNFAGEVSAYENTWAMNSSSYISDTLGAWPRAAVELGCT